MQRVIILMFSLLFIISCNRDEQCPVEDFTGTYLGDADCILGLTDQEDVEVTVTRLDDKTVEINFRGNILEARVKGCDLDVQDNVSLGSGYSGSASVSEETLTLTYQVKVAGILTEECDFVGVKI